MTDTTCKAALDCLQTCEFNDQESQAGGAATRCPACMLAHTHSGKLHTPVGASARGAAAASAAGPASGSTCRPASGICRQCSLRSAQAPPAWALSAPAAATLQVCSYRCITSYESPLLEVFSLCIIQKHNWCGARAAATACALSGRAACDETCGTAAFPLFCLCWPVRVADGGAAAVPSFCCCPLATHKTTELCVPCSFGLTADIPMVRCLWEQRKPAWLSMLTACAPMCRSRTPGLLPPHARAALSCLSCLPLQVPDPAPLATWRGQPMTHELAEDLFIGWLQDPSTGLQQLRGEEKLFSWQVFAGELLRVTTQLHMRLAGAC